MGLMCDVSKTSDVEETNEKECTHRSICHLVISNMYDIAFSFFAELLTIREWFALALLDNTYRNAIVSAHSRDFSVPLPTPRPEHLRSTRSKIDRKYMGQIHWDSGACILMPHFEGLCRPCS